MTAGRRSSASAAVAVAAASALAAGCDSKSSTVAPSASVPIARFVARLEGSGVDFRHDAGGSGRKLFPEINAGGVALFDHDGDGDLDLWFAQGAPLPGRDPAQVATSCAQPWLDRLYRNDGDFHFVDVTAATHAGEVGFSFSAACPDVDGDGDLDLYVCNLDGNRLLVNDGHGRFVDATASSGLRCGAWSSCASFADLDGDGDLDAYVGNYLVYDLDHPKPCGETERGAQYLSYCHPDVFPGAKDVLYRNDGGRDGAVRFVDVTAEAGCADSRGKTLAVVPGDVDDDGDIDLYVATDHVPNELWRNDTPRGGKWKLVDVAAEVGVAQDGSGRSQSCMGSDVQDVDGDGDLDLFSANMAQEINVLYVNENHGKYFVDDTELAGLGRDSYWWVGFGAKFFDQDLDGDLDLALANGHVLDNIALYDPHQSFAQQAQFYENEGHGKFKLASSSCGPYFAESHVGRGLAVGDLDDDGDPDVVVVHWNDRPQILENTTIARTRSATGRGGATTPAGPNWIGLKLKAKGANSQAIGARATCDAGDLHQLQEVHGAGSYAAWNDTRIVFGLGDRGGYDRITIRWPDGSTQTVSGLATRRYHTIDQP